MFHVKQTAEKEPRMFHVKHPQPVTAKDRQPQDGSVQVQNTAGTGESISGEEIGGASAFPQQCDSVGVR